MGSTLKELPRFLVKSAAASAALLALGGCFSITSTAPSNNAEQSAVTFAVIPVGFNVTVFPSTMQMTAKGATASFTVSAGTNYGT
jgi:hypothetical protein